MAIFGSKDDPHASRIVPNEEDKPTSKVKYARINGTAGAETEVVAAVTGKKIRVLGYTVGAAGAAGLVTMQDTATTPVVHAEHPLAINGNVSVGGGPGAPAFETASGTGVEVKTVATQTATGTLTFAEVG